jgi:hypothetical protein
VLIPGVIESKSNFVEHPELIANRIGNYAKLVGRENVIAGSDCGFGTWVGQAAVDPDVVWAKFAAIAEGARIASKRWNVGYDALWVRYAHIEKPDKYSFLNFHFAKVPRDFVSNALPRRCGRGSCLAQTEPIKRRLVKEALSLRLRAAAQR